MVFFRCSHADDCLLSETIPNDITMIMNPTLCKDRPIPHERFSFETVFCKYSYITFCALNRIHNPKYTKTLKDPFG